jgi:hypothetical protein
LWEEWPAENFSSMDAYQRGKNVTRRRIRKRETEEITLLYVFPDTDKKRPSEVQETGG